MPTQHSIDQLPILVERCASGDQDAFDDLYQLTAPKLFALALGILGREDRAAEALQDSYLNIWHHAADYQPDKGTPMTWMASIVRH